MFNVVSILTSRSFMSASVRVLQISHAVTTATPICFTALFIAFHFLRAERGHARLGGLCLRNSFMARHQIKYQRRKATQRAHAHHHDEPNHAKANCDHQSRLRFRRFVGFISGL